MLSILVVSAVMLTGISALGLVILFFVGRDKSHFDFKQLFVSYFYLISMIGLLTTLFGAASITKATLSDLYGRDFSYPVYDRPMVSPPSMEETVKPADGDTEIQKMEAQRQMENEERQRVESQYKDDLFTGTSALLVGLLFWAVHTFGWMRLESPNIRKHSVLFRGFVLLQLVAYSLITLTVLPMAISQWLRHALLANQAAPQATPGDPVSIAIWVLPVWLIFVWLTLKHVRGSAEPASRN